MVKYNFQLGTGDNAIRFKAHFASKGDMYIVLPSVVKISIHKSGQTHLKPPSGGKPIIFDGHAFAQDIYKKKSQMFTKTTSDLPESPGAIGIIRTSQLRNKITSGEFKKTFNPRNIIADPSLLGDTFISINTHNLNAKFDKITKNTHNIDDFLFFCYFEDEELCCSCGNTTNRYIFKLDLNNEESFNKIPGYEVISPAMNMYYKQYLL